MTALLRSILTVVPVRTGRLYRSFRITQERDQIVLRFKAPYAFWPEVRSRLNSYYFRRGLRAGVRAANRATGRQIIFRTVQMPTKVMGAQMVARLKWKFAEATIDDTTL